MSSKSWEVPWLNEIDRVLQPQNRTDYSVCDLYAGAGGFSLGFAATGFRCEGYDFNESAVQTYRANIGNAHFHDLRKEHPKIEADVLIAGPPCQPWSRAGSQRGEVDERDGFPVISNIVEKVNPKAIVVENVADIALKRHRKSLDEFKLALTVDGYSVTETVLNAADYSVPQNRRRAFIFAIRDSMPIGQPRPSGRLVTVREAIGDTCEIGLPSDRFLTQKMDRYIARYEKASGCKVPRDLHLDRPARTLTVRNLAGATGDMLRLCLPCGRRRMLTIQEAARLQSFPDWFRFSGLPQSQYSQIGNAVPPLLSLAIAKRVRQELCVMGFRP